MCFAAGDVRICRLWYSLRIPTQETIHAGQQLPTVCRLLYDHGEFEAQPENINIGHVEDSE
jgi:hypothetical protein